MDVQNVTLPAEPLFHLRGAFFLSFLAQIVGWKIPETFRFKWKGFLSIRSKLAISLVDQNIYVMV